jgi:protein-export membrane protein SecD/preprotein translocase SecF subunit
MFGTIRNRLILIAVLVVAAIAYLYPRQITVRQRGPDGVMRDVREKAVPLKLGLDLQGGMHLALELDQSKKVSANPREDIQRAVTVLRKRIDEFGVTEPLIQQTGGDRIVVELAGITDPARAKQIVQRSAFLEFRITDKAQALDKALPAMDRALRGLGIGPAAGGVAPARPSVVEQLLRGDSTKPKTDTTEVTGGVLSGLIQPASVAGIPPEPGEYAVAETAFPRVDSLINLPAVRALWPRNVEFSWAGQPTSAGVNQYRLLYALADKPIITGERLVDASAAIDPLTNGPIVRFELDRAGGRVFGAETGKHVGDYMAILLDGRVQGRPPVIQSRIERNGQITMGNRSLQEAQDLALTLRAGALPVPLKIVEERQVTASLGEDSIHGGVVAGVVGTALVILIMLGYYALSGALAVAALAFYVLFALGGLAMLEATLTLPGIAGLILSVGIAVDANVLIFERIREELARGKTVRLAVDEGFKHAMPAIIDSNLATVLTALFLFQFGTGPVKGFAVTLIMGIFASMITAVFVTRTFYMLWLKRRPDMPSLSVGSLRLFKDAHYDFIAVRKYAYGVTAAMLAIGLVFLLVRPFNYSIEFTGGTLVQFHADASVTDAQLRAGLDAGGLRGAEVQGFGAPGDFVIRARSAAVAATDPNNTQATAAQVTKALDGVLGAGKYRVDRSEAVGPKVGGELRQQALLAIFLSFFAVLGYLAYRFEWRFGVAAVVATAHDILATIGFIAVMHLEVSLVVVAGVLTMVGYSLNDTIIIFDRVREDLKKYPKDGFVQVLNRAINETLPRSILTHGTTIATLLSLAIFGGEVIRPFALVMFFGVFTGTFSSIYIASPVLLYIQTRWPGAQARGVRPAVPAPPLPGGGGRKPQPVG